LNAEHGLGDDRNDVQGGQGEKRKRVGIDRVIDQDQTLLNQSINRMEDLEDSEYASFLISALKEMKTKVFSLLENIACRTTFRCL
jgi:hypothetical protein